MSSLAPIEIQRLAEFPADQPAVVIVGNGPVGLQAARLLLAQPPDSPLLLYGAETTQPYNRVRLSSVLAGTDSLSSLENDLDDGAGQTLYKRYGCRVTGIDCAAGTIMDDQGRTQSYSKLILATGSRAHVPNIRGIEKPGVYTLRDLNDVNHLMARQAASRDTVILGGGLLGLEAARAMQRWNTHVTIVEHTPRLLSRQLDEEAGQLLAEAVREIGIQLELYDGVRSIEGDDRVDSIVLRSGRRLPCDTLVVAAGIVPNTELALQAGLAIGRGIKVNDRMQTSQPDIYAVGECIEHRGKIYGLVAPGLEQAGVAVHDLLGGTGSYHGSIAASRLKVLDQTVLSIGPVQEEAQSNSARSYVYRNRSQSIYRKILVHRHRLVGVLSIGEWDAAARMQSHASEQRWILPWQIWRFRLQGSLWPEQDLQSVSDWPAGATVCQCTGVTRGRISEVIAQGEINCLKLTETTGAGSVCGSCRPLLEQLLGSDEPKQANEHAGLLTMAALASSLLAVLFLLPLQIPYQDSVQVDLAWDWLWRDGFAKQVTGFSMLGLFGLGLILSLRKRWPRLRHLGRFSVWRSAHLVLGVLTLVALFAHTGLRMGSGLNIWLMSSFIGLILLGSINSAALGQQHRLDGAGAARLKQWSLRWHIFLFWPVPVLLAFHVLKSYWF